MKSFCLQAEQKSSEIVFLRYVVTKLCKQYVPSESVRASKLGKVSFIFRKHHFFSVFDRYFLAVQ